MKFKVGDRVKFIGKTTEHKSYGNDLEADIKKYNNVFTIAYISGGYAEFEENRCWYIQENEIELVQEKQFHKADLKDGDKCTLKNGEIVYFSTNCKRATKYIFENLDANLKYNINDDVSIVKVERPIKHETVFERKEEILDETEKRYLSNIIRPFRDKVEGIEKCSYLREFIKIYIKEDEPIILPYLEKGTMYKGMEENKRYTLKELCL